MPNKFTALSILLRWALALFGVFATYNPSGYSYWHWVQRGDGLVSLRVLAGIGLLVFYVVYARATLRSLGPIGISLATALFGAVAWVLMQLHLLDVSRDADRIVASLSISASVLGIGMSWSAIRYRISGQYDSEDVGGGPLG
jgi:hypothetical protein